MPWYPVKDYGDFSLKMQWRDSSTGAIGNSGVFVRFPQPEEAVARPPAERFPCQVGSATSQPAWVAIFCGHEIQINDAQTSEPQKTGSIYNFSPNNATQAQVQPKGTWVDYEVRVVGQTYTIIRNGNVIKQFVNSPDQAVVAAGRSADQRPPVRARLHRPPEPRRQRRDRLPQRPRAAARRGRGPGAGHRQGDGEHTVEYRSTDVGGQRGSDQVRTRSRSGRADETPPVTTHSLDPADPGEGGTYNGPVDVTLSATDPEEGGSEPATHDVNAEGFSWNPNALDVAFGDVVRWNFPAGGFPHDVWVIEPGEAPDSAGREITSGPVPGGGPPVSETLDEAGTWTFVCKLHSSVGGGAWRAWSGPPKSARVAAPGPPASTSPSTA